MNNTPITTADIDQAPDIYGLLESMLKGKDTRRKSNSHQRTLWIPILPKILSEYRDLKLFINIIYVCGFSFLIIRSSNIYLGSVHHLKSRSLKIIAQGLKIVFDKHCGRGF